MFDQAPLMAHDQKHRLASDTVFPTCCQLGLSMHRAMDQSEIRVAEIENLAQSEPLEAARLLEVFSCVSDRQSPDGEVVAGLVPEASSSCTIIRHDHCQPSGDELL